MDSRIIILLKSNGLTIFDSFIGEGKSLNFTEDAVKHLEVADKEQLRSQIKDFISGMSSQNVLMMLAKDVVFQKSLSASEQSLDVKTADFFSKVPFSQEKKAFKKIEAGGQIYLFSTNLEFYKTIVECLGGAGWKVEQVVPVGIFPRLIDKTSFSPEEVGDILDSGDVLEQGNFIADEEFVVDKIDEKSSETAPRNWKKIIFIGLTFIVLVILIGVGAYRYRNNNHAKEEIKKLSEEASPSAAIVATIDKSKLSLQVLNGSGIVGQAGRIKDILSKAGFENIETGNLNLNKKSDTIASFSAVVAKSNREEIVKMLEDFFMKIDIQESSASAKFDVQIITGSRLKP